MGGSSSTFNKKELEEYQELTFLTKKEILQYVQNFTGYRVIEIKFKQLDPDAVNIDRNARIDSQKMLQMNELEVNPFRDRILEVFSTADDRSLSFDDFLDMMSAFSDAAPPNVKSEYAFMIYDFNGDDFIDEFDIREIVNRLTGDQKLDDIDMDLLVNDIMDEADLDDDNKLSYAEFEHIISKAPDFVDSFRIRI